MSGIQHVWPIVGAAGGDPFWAQVLLLMHCEQDSPFLDHSSYARTLTATGSVTASTDQADEGSKAAKYPNTATTYISPSDDEDFRYGGTGEHTIEFSIYIVANAATRMYVVNKFAAGSTSGFGHRMQILGGGSTIDNGYSTGSAQFGGTATGSLGTGAWRKIAFERWNDPASSSDKFSSYVDGLRVSQLADVGTLAIASQSGGFEIGSRETFSDTKPNYYLDEIRITAAARFQGAASYTPQVGAFPDF